MTRAIVVGGVEKVASMAIKIHGRVGAGIEVGVEMHLRDVLVITMYESTNDIQCATIARQLLCSLFSVKPSLS